MQKEARGWDEDSKLLVSRLAHAAEKAFADRALLRNDNERLLAQNNEKRSRTSKLARKVGNAKVMGYEDIIEAQRTLKQKKPPRLKSIRPIPAGDANQRGLAAVMMYEGLKMKYKAETSKSTVHANGRKIPASFQARHRLKRVLSSVSVLVLNKINGLSDLIISNTFVCIILEEDLDILDPLEECCLRYSSPSTICSSIYFSPMLNEKQYHRRALLSCCDD
ncbi:hypothetical protein PENSUB_4337 [Penicillium subrubescens]|uniref:Uncharacterized protein n=1 Tax=Penicillium subrubescens TaxID=1316194 RepID=A0A1Q5UCQ5_9EURO|nr:hypothetical protein PENSUB_4337 [Penicillium subrubescens]